jgi:hypothetical protein
LIAARKRRIGMLYVVAHTCGDAARCSRCMVSFQRCLGTSEPDGPAQDALMVFALGPQRQPGFYFVMFGG